MERARVPVPAEPERRAPAQRAVPAGPHALLRMQRLAGNAATARAVAQRAPERPGPSALTPETSGPGVPEAGAAPPSSAEGQVALGAEAAAPPPPAAPPPAASPPASPPPGAGPPVSGLAPAEPAAPSSRPAPFSAGGVPTGPLGFLGALTGVAPSALAGPLAGLGTAGAAALGAYRDELALPARPEPTGLPTVLSARPSVGPAPSGPEPAPPSPGGLATGEATDPGAAERLGSAGVAALDRAAGAVGTGPAPPVGTIAPVGLAGTLPALAPAPATVPDAAPGMVPALAGDEAAALDNTMGAELAGRVGALLAPASAASAVHTAEMTAARTEADDTVATVRAETAARQQAAAQAAHAEVSGLHSGWVGERAAAVAEHGGAIRAEASRVAGAVSAAVASADSKASAEAAKSGEQPSGGGGLWDRIKSAGRAVAGAVTGVVGGILAAARKLVTGLVTGLWDTVQRKITAVTAALREGARRAWSAMSAAVDRARRVVSDLAASAVSLARRAWAAAADRLGRAWASLQRAAGAAYAAVRAAAAAVANAAAKIRQIVALLSNRLLGFLFDIVRDPQSKIVAPVVAKAAPYAATVPGKAEELAAQQRGGGAPPGPSGPAAPVQRQQATGVEPAPPGEDFDDGVKRHLRAAGRDFAAHWGEVLANVIFSIMLWFPMLMEEGPKLWDSLGGLFGPAGQGGLDRVDHCFDVLRRLMNIVAGTFATVGFWALMLGWLGGPIGEGIALGGFVTAGAYIAGADIVLGLAEMTNDYLGATKANGNPATRDRYLSRFTGSAISTAIVAVLLLLGFIASRFARRFQARRAAAEVETRSTGKQPAPDEKPPVPEEERPKVEPPTSLAAWRTKLQLLQKRVATLRQKFAASGSTDAALDAEITRLETTAGDMSTRRDGARGTEDLPGFGRELRDLEGRVRDVERRLEGAPVRPVSAVQQQLADRLGMDVQTIAGFLDDAQCHRILNLINTRGIVGDRLAGLRKFVQEYAGRGRDAAKLMDLLDTDWPELRQLLDDRARVSWDPNWRGRPRIENGNADEGWQHIDERHVTGNAAGGPGDLFAPGTTRAEVQAAAEEVVRSGERVSRAGARMQTFELRTTVHGQSDNIRVRVDSSDGRVITAFPVRGG